MDVFQTAASPLSENVRMTNTPISSSTQRREDVYTLILDVAVYFLGFEVNSKWAQMYESSFSTEAMRTVRTRSSRSICVRISLSSDKSYSKDQPLVSNSALQTFSSHQI